MKTSTVRDSLLASSAGGLAAGLAGNRAGMILVRGLALVALVESVLCVGFVRPAAAQLTVVYSNDFESYAPDSYPFPTNPLSGWNAMPSQSGLVPSIVTPPVNETGNALNMDGYGGGATSWMSVNTPLLAGSTSDWSATASARYLSSNYEPNKWYGVGGLLMSSTGDMSGDYIWLTIQSGWGEVNATTTWARPTLDWRLAGTSGGGVLFPWDPPAGVSVVEGNAMRMSTDTWGPAIMGLSRTNGSSSLAYTISSPVDGPFSGSVAFSGAQATALDNLQYVGFANYLSVWQFDNLSVSAVGPAVITINVASGTQTQTQAGYPLLSGTTPVEKIGLGTVVVDQANTLTGPTTVSQGTLELATANALSASAVTVAAGATLSVGPQVSAVVPALVNNGLVDVAFGELTVVSGLTAEGLKTQIVAGRNEGAWDGATGITSSGAAGTADRAVGWIDNGDGSFRFGYAAAGDLDMNGLVDLDDVIAFVGGGLYDTGSPAVWAQGDYDYNGIVDLDDVIAFVGGGLYDKGPYNQPVGGLSLMGFGGGEDLGLMNGGFTAVPEPATWVLVAIGAAFISSRALQKTTAA